MVVTRGVRCVNFGLLLFSGGICDLLFFVFFHCLSPAFCKVFYSIGICLADSEFFFFRRICVSNMCF